MQSIVNRRDNNFNILSFLAAILVIMGHMCHLIGIVPISFMGQPVSTLAVKILFVTSGYLTALSYMRDRNFFRYMIKRGARLLPGLIGVVLFSTVIVGPIFSSLSVRDYFANPITYSYLKNIVFNTQYFLPGLFETNPYPNAVNGSLWTLPIQLALYIALPIVFMIFSKLDKIKISLVLAALLEVFNIFLQICHPTFRLVIWGTDIAQAVTIAPYFFLGIAYTSDKVKKWLNLQVASLLMLGGAILQLSGVKMEALIFIVLPYFVFSFALSENPVFGRFSVKNDISYGMYLYGFVIQQVIVRCLWKYDLSFNVYMVISVICVIICAFLSWFIIEKPAQKLGKIILSIPKIKGMNQRDMKMLNE